MRQNRICSSVAVAASRTVGLHITHRSIIKIERTQKFQSSVCSTPWASLIHLPENLYTVLHSSTNRKEGVDVQAHY